MTMTTIERVVALQRVRPVRRRPGPDPRRRRPARARGRRRRRRRSSSPRARWRTTCSRWCAGRSASTTASATVAILGAGVDRRRAGRARARAALRVGDGARADDCCSGSTSRCSTSCSPTGPRSRAGSSPRSSRWSGSEPRAEADTSTAVTGPPRRRAAAAVAWLTAQAAGLRRDGRAARDRRQRDVPRRVRLGVAARDVHRDRRGRDRRLRRRRPRRAAVRPRAASPSSVLGGAAVAHRAPPGSSPRAETARGCRCRCWCCSRS